MCGRHRLSRRKQFIDERFDTIPGEDDWVPRYNVAPTQPVPIIRQHPKEPRRALSLVRWDLDKGGLRCVSWARAAVPKLLPALLLFSVSREKFSHWDSCKELKPLWRLQA
jgi:SOS response associated peptidase (SRAP)